MCGWVGVQEASDASGAQAEKRRDAHRFSFFKDWELKANSWSNQINKTCERDQTRNRKAAYSSLKTEGYLQPTYNYSRMD